MEYDKVMAGPLSVIDKATGDISLGLSETHLALLNYKQQNFSKLLIALNNEIIHFFGVDERAYKIERNELDRPTFESDDPTTWR